MELDNQVLLMVQMEQIQFFQQLHQQEEEEEVLMDQHLLMLVNLEDQVEAVVKEEQVLLQVEQEILLQ